MFNITAFIMETLKGMAGNYPDFQIREFALNWYAKGKLTEVELAELESFLNPPTVEEEETVEEEATVEEEETVEEEAATV